MADERSLVPSDIEVIRAPLDNPDFCFGDSDPTDVGQCFSDSDPDDPVV